MFRQLSRVVLGGALYCLVEMAFRGYTHISMFLVGGLCFLLLSFLGRLPIPFCRRALLGAAAVTIIEFVSGLLLNRLLRLDVWDYSDQPFNLLGQICPLFFLLWIPLCAAGILLNAGLDRLPELRPSRRHGREP